MDYTNKTNDDSNGNDDSNNNYIPTPLQTMIERIVTKERGFDSRIEIPSNAKDSLIGVQIALANMDINDGEFNDSDIGEITKKLSGLVQQLNKSGIPYNAITSIDGFNVLYENAKYEFKRKSPDSTDDLKDKITKLMDVIYKPKPTKLPSIDPSKPEDHTYNKLYNKFGFIFGSTLDKNYLAPNKNDSIKNGIDNNIFKKKDDFDKNKPADDLPEWVKRIIDEVEKRIRQKNPDKPDSDKPDNQPENPDKKQ